MPLPRNPRTASFSLVELVIVVVIIGVIAAIAVPRISGSYGKTSETALVGDLAAMRRAIDMYAAEHNHAHPGSQPDGSGGGANSSAAFISQLTKCSDVNGNVSTTRDAQYRFGPYLRRMPEQPVGKNKRSPAVAVDTVNSPPVVTTGAEGWVYNPITGEIIANTDDANFDNTQAFDEY